VDPYFFVFCLLIVLGGGLWILTMAIKRNLSDAGLVVCPPPGAEVILLGAPRDGKYPVRLAKSKEEMILPWQCTCVQRAVRLKLGLSSDGA
jgi:hypothetical protein